MSDLSFVCCIEAGPLEVVTLRMIESLRRWGGKLAQAPIFAVTPRFGPPLLEQTIKKMKLFDVNYTYFRANEKYSWNNFMNKPHALARVEKETTSEYIAWLDSDTLIINEPCGFNLSQTEDFAACAPDKNVGTAGPQDPNEPYWQGLGRALGVDIVRLPWIITETEKEKIRLYFNSGVFVFRQGKNFAAEYLADCRRLLDARISSKYAGIFFTDQVALGLTLIRLQMSYKTLPSAYNYAIGGKSLEAFIPDKLLGIKILHHHDAMWPSLWPRLMSCMLTSRPDVHEWLQGLGPLINPLPLHWRLAAKLLKNFRSRRLAAYQKKCQIF